MQNSLVLVVLSSRQQNHKLKPREAASLSAHITALKHGEVQGYPTIEWFYNGHDHRVRPTHLRNKRSKAAALDPKANGTPRTDTA